MKVNLYKAIIGAALAMFLMTGCQAEAESESGGIFDELLTDTGDDYRRIIDESDGLISAEYDVRTYETLQQTYTVCDVTVTDGYTGFDKNSCLNYGGSHEVFESGGLFSADSKEAVTVQGHSKSYSVMYNIIPTVHYVYVKTDDNWRHALTTADYVTMEYNRWYFYETDDHDSLVRENTRTSSLSDEQTRDCAAIDAYDLEEFIDDLPRECVIELEGGEHDYGTFTVNLNLPLTAAALYNRIKDPIHPAVWIFAGLLFVCAVAFVPFVVDKYRRKKNTKEYAEFVYNPGDGSDVDE